MLAHTLNARPQTAVDNIDLQRFYVRLDQVYTISSANTIGPKVRWHLGQLESPELRADLEQPTVQSNR